MRSPLTVYRQAQNLEDLEAFAYLLNHIYRQGGYTYNTIPDWGSAFASTTQERIWDFIRFLARWSRMKNSFDLMRTVSMDLCRGVIVFRPSAGDPIEFVMPNEFLIYFQTGVLPELQECA